jgi:myosin-1
MENLRVRRAGFAYRRPFAQFLERYKCICRETWPRFAGTPREGCRLVLGALGLAADEFSFGRTKLFVRRPVTLALLDERLVATRHRLAALIQARFRGFAARQHFLALRAAVVVLAKNWRRRAAQRQLARLRWARFVIARFVRGYAHRHEPRSAANARVRWRAEAPPALPNPLTSAAPPR